MSGKKRSFTVAFKLEAVEYALQNSSEGAARKYKVDSKRIREWRRQKCKLLELSDVHIDRKRLKGGGRHIFSERMEERLANWVRESRNNKVHVSRKTIQQEAQRLHNELEGESGQKFTASRGWLQRFLERNGFVGTKSTGGHKDPNKIMSKLIQHVMNMRQMHIKNNYGSSNVIIMDEVLCSLDCTSDEKLRFTVCLAAKGDGTKLMPYVVFVSGAENVANVEMDIKGVVATQNQNGCMTATCMISWLQKVVGASSEKRLLVWDSYGYHVSHETVQEAVSCNIDLAIVPGGCSKHIHAPECFWNERFKKKLKDLHTQWIENGNAGVPAKEVVVQWLVEAWDEFPVSFIANSVRLCAVTVATDGSEDDEIQCFKSCEPFEGGREILKSWNAELHEKINAGEVASIECEDLSQNASGDDEDDIDEILDEHGITDDSDSESKCLNVDYFIKKE